MKIKFNQLNKEKSKNVLRALPLGKRQWVIVKLWCTYIFIHQYNTDIELCRCYLLLCSAYHGHSNLLMDCSPYKMKQMNKVCDKDFVHVAPAPDSYRGMYRGNDVRTGEKYAKELKSMIDNTHKDGRKVST